MFNFLRRPPASTQPAEEPIDILLGMFKDEIRAHSTTWDLLRASWAREDELRAEIAELKRGKAETTPASFVRHSDEAIGVTR